MSEFWHWAKFIMKIFVIPTVKMFTHPLKFRKVLKIT